MTSEDKLKLRVLLWDVDGTILNFAEAERHAIKKGFERYGLGECTDEMLEVYSGINIKYWKMLERGEMTKAGILTERFREFFDLYGIGSTENIVERFNETYQHDLGDIICINDDALKVIDGIPGDVLQYAITNGTAVAQNRKISESGLRKRMDGIFISEEVGYEKPRIEFMDAVMADIRSRIPDIAKSEILVIGDSLTSDIQLANNTDVRCCWYNPQRAARPADLRIDFEISSLDELIGMI